MSLSLLLLMLINTAYGAFSLLNLTLGRISSKEEKLNNLQPWNHRQYTDVVIDSPLAWRRLDQGHCKRPSGNVVLVELKSVCFTPTNELLQRISTEFIMFGPYYDSHHLNFGPLSELGHPQGASLFEARLTNKLYWCAEREQALDRLKNLMNNKFLKHWVVHQHVRDDMQHPKLRILPIGFGYHDQRATDKQYRDLIDWKNMVIDVNVRADADKVPRDRLLLTTFQIHTNLFGDTGDDPRSELLRNLSATPSLAQYAAIQKFNGPREFAEALRSYKFVLSPWGWGPDCFRHYESIALGAIPIVLSDWAQDQAVAKLPVLIVNDWAELSEEMLLREYERIHSGSYEWERLMLSYWEDKLFWVPSDAHRVCLIAN
jgi:hypothetical protein